MVKIPLRMWSCVGLGYLSGALLEGLGSSPGIDIGYWAYLVSLPLLFVAFMLYPYEENK